MDTGTIAEKTKISGKRFAREYIKRGFNGTKTIQALEPDIKPDTANVKASRLLRNDSTQRALAEILREDGFTDGDIRRLLKRNAGQKKNISASNQALDLAMKVRGDYAPVKSLSISLTPEQIDGRIDELLTELKQLKAGNTD